MIGDAPTAAQSAVQAAAGSAAAAPAAVAPAPAPAAVSAAAGPAASILIEWENVLTADCRRAYRMLERLAADSHEVAEPLEILICHDPSRVPREAVESALHAHFYAERPADRVTVSVVAAPGRTYFGLRNFGATIARGEWLLCLDSDVVPEPGWIKRLLDAARSAPQANVVGGATHLDPEGLLGKAFAAGWFFPLRDDDDSLRSGVEDFFANNVAFRRSFFLAHPYPDDPGSGETRNASRRMAAELRAAGIPIHRAGAARAAHPAPRGGIQFFVRALAEGRDEAVGWQKRGRNRLRRLLRAPAFALGRWNKAVRTLVGERRKLSASVLQIPVAAAIMAVYSAFLCAGAATQALLPRRAVPAWRI